MSEQQIPPTAGIDLSARPRLTGPEDENLLEYEVLSGDPLPAREDSTPGATNQQGEQS